MAPAHDILKLHAPILKPAAAGKHATQFAVKHYNPSRSIVDEQPQFAVGAAQLLAVRFELSLNLPPLSIRFVICGADCCQQRRPVSLGHNIVAKRPLQLAPQQPVVVSINDVDKFAFTGLAH